MNDPAASSTGDAPDSAASSAPDTAATFPEFSGIRVVVVAHGPPMKGGIATVALDIVEDPALNAEFEVVFQNTTQNDDSRGKFAIENVKRAFVDSWNTFRLARKGAVVHSHSVQYPWLTGWRQVGIALAARLRGAKVLLHNHAQPPYMEAPGEYRVDRLNAAAFAVLDRLVEANICIAAAGEPNLRTYMPTVDLPVIANSAVVDDIVQSSAVHELPVVLFIGEMLERKGILTLLDAMDLLDERGVGPYDLRIVSDNRPGLDPDKDAMIKAITDRGRADAMTGPLARSEVYANLAESDVYVFPTWTEGQPFTVIEALSSGVPIVASDIQAISAMISDGENGRLLPMTDATAFADAIEELLGDPDRRREISDANRALARRRFDRPVFSESLAELYRRHGRAR